METFADQLGTSLRIEKRRYAVGTILFLASVITATGVYLWRCQFGVDLTDEAFYLLPAWKFYDLGDLPFRDEIFNGLRHSDLLNALFIKPLVGFSVLELRRAAVVVYAVVLTLFTVVSFRKHVGVIAAITLVTCLTFDYFLMPTWSYNWWCRNSILIHHTAILIATLTASQGIKKLSLAVAGGSLAFLSIAYNPLVVVIPIGAITCWFVDRRWFRWYVYPALILVGLDLLFCLHPAVRPDWWISVHALSGMGEYSIQAAVHKAWGTLTYVLLHPEFYLTLLSALLLWDEPVWNEKWKGLSSVLSQMRWIAFLILPIFIIRFSLHPTPESTLQDFASIAMGGAAILLLAAWVQKNHFLSLCVIQSLAAAWGMALSSTNQHLALVWMLPSLLIPFFALLTSESISRMKGRTTFRKWEPLLGLIVFGVPLLELGYGAFYHQRYHNYYEVPPGNCTTELSIPPLQGLKTSQRRAELITELDRIASNHEFGLAFADVPGAYYFGRVRPSVDTSIVETDAPTDTNRRSITRLFERNRTPKYLLKTTVHPWYWGIQHPLADKASEYPKDDPYIAFMECARGERLFASKEFQAFSVDDRKLPGCRPDNRIPANRVAQGFAQR